MKAIHERVKDVQDLVSTYVTQPIKYNLLKPSQRLTNKLRQAPESVAVTAYFFALLSYSLYATFYADPQQTEDEKEVQTKTSTYIMLSLPAILAATLNVRSKLPNQAQQFLNTKEQKLIQKLPLKAKMPYLLASTSPEIKKKLTIAAITVLPAAYIIATTLWLNAQATQYYSTALTSNLTSIDKENFILQMSTWLLSIEATSQLFKKMLTALPQLNKTVLEWRKEEKTIKANKEKELEFQTFQKSLIKKANEMPLELLATKLITEQNTLESLADTLILESGLPAQPSHESICSLFSLPGFLTVTNVDGTTERVRLKSPTAENEVALEELHRSLGI